MTASGTGAWSYTTPALSNGAHGLTATATDVAGNTGAASTALSVTIDTVAPLVTQTTATPSTGTALPGDTIALTLTLSEPVTITGTPTLALNNGGTATYAGGSGGDILTFKYTVGLNDSTVSALAVTAIGLLNGAEIKDVAGNTANLSGALTTFSGLHVDPPVPPVSPAWNNPVSSDLPTTPVAPRTIAVHLSADEVNGAKLLSQDSTYDRNGAPDRPGQVIMPKAGALVFDAAGHNVGADTFTTINVGRGNDRVAGSAGADKFVFTPDFGKDVIADFQASGLQHDVLQFRHDTFADFATVLAHATQVVPDVAITADAMSGVTLQGIDLSSLQKYDFHFV